MFAKFWLIEWFRSIIYYVWWQYEIILRKWTHGCVGARLKNVTYCWHLSGWHHRRSLKSDIKSKTWMILQERESLHFYTNIAFILFGNTAENMKKVCTTWRELTYMKKLTAIQRYLKPGKEMLNSCINQIHFI